MALPKLTAGGSPPDFTFEKARFLPVNTPINPLQIIGKAGGGQVKVANLGDDEEFFVIVVNRVSQTNRDDLLTFIQHANVNYSLNTVTFVDENSATTTVRIWNVQGLDFPRVRGGNLYNLKLLLRKEIT